MMKQTNSRAQGTIVPNTASIAQSTIEYLVIIAVVVVITLVVVALVLNMSDSDATQINSNKNQNLIGKGGISIIDSVISSTGDGVISLQNTLGENLTIKTIIPGAENNCEKILSPGEKYNCYLTDVNAACPCSAGQRVVCDFKITFESKNGLEKVETFTIINDCTDLNITDPNPTYYTLSYDGNGATTGSPPNDENDYENGDTAVILGPGPMEKDGYNFLYWKNNSTDTSYNENDSFIITNNTTLYAQWEEETIEFECDEPLAGGYFCNGSGTEDSPFGIYDINMLQKIDQNLEADYILLNDIDASETMNWNCDEFGNNCKGFEPIGQWSSYPFRGSFDGNNHTISNLYINRPNESYVALFSYLNDSHWIINPNLIISNLKLVDVNINGANFVGGVVASGSYYGSSLYAQIRRVSVSGTIRGGSRLGLIAGMCGNMCLISESFSTGTIIGRRIEYTNSAYVGGIAGDGPGKIENSYSSANVTGYDMVGGLVGAPGTVTSSYSVGEVNGSNYFGGLVGYAGTVTNSYWNTDIHPTSYGGTGLTTAEMKQSTNYSGWDFDTVWNITNGTTYPYLRNNTQTPNPQ